MGGLGVGNIAEPLAYLLLDLAAPGSNPGFKILDIAKFIDRALLRGRVDSAKKLSSRSNPQDAG